MKIAIYLRVSTQDQVNKGNTNRDGFSIPAQREACLRKAESLNGTIIKEYVDRGESARSAARPALQRLLKDLSEKKNFDYVIVHKLDRLARNTYDDVTICLTIRKSGAQLVSVMENIDETPSGVLMHGIMAAIAEFYSRNLAVEALKGSTEKAKQGGTPFYAPIGYTNIIERTNHRENRTVIIDSERAQLVIWALERFATGDYTKQRLREELEKRGLKSRPNSQSSGKPISYSGVDRMLTNRYYIGYVNYCGKEYKGKHQPLVTLAVFAAIKAVLDSQRSNRGKSYKHNHYLSRLLKCSKCHRHLCFSISKHKYPYFFCMNRADTGCTQPYIPVNLIEDAIFRTFEKFILSKTDREELVKQIDAELNVELNQGKIEVRRQKLRLDKLHTEQDNLLQAYYSKVIENTLMKREQKRINNEITSAQSLIDEVEKRQSIINERKERALEIARGLNIAKAFSKANPIIKRHFCQALFSWVEINDQISTNTTKKMWWLKDHEVKVLDVNWHNPLNIRHITEAILSLALERN